MNQVKIFLKKKLGKKYHFLRLKKILSFFFGDVFWNLRKIFKKILNPIKLNLSQKVERQQIIEHEKGFVIDFTIDNYFTFHLRPKKNKHFNLISTNTIKEKIGIVIQGPIDYQKKFLIETLKIYQKIFQNSFIYISTWIDEEFDYNYINDLKNVKIFKNPEPLKSPYNIDHQIVSTYRGIIEAEKDGCSFILKTRPDIRINKSNSESFLLSIFKTFSTEIPGGRIIAPSLTTFKYRLYGLTDIVLFGSVQNMKKYFDNTLYLESLKNYKNLDHNNFINETPVVAEIFLCSRYLMSSGEDLKWDLEDYWDKLKKYFCIIDTSSLDLFWNKYEHEYEYRFIRTYKDKTPRGIDFSDWLSLYQGFDVNWKKVISDHERYDENFRVINLF